MPFIGEILLSLGKSEHFSSPDLRFGYHEMVLYDESIPKIAFITAKGKFEFLTVPLGLIQAPTRFKEMMNRFLQKLLFVK